MFLIVSGFIDRFHTYVSICTHVTRIPFHLSLLTPTHLFVKCSYIQTHLHTHTCIYILTMFAYRHIYKHIHINVCMYIIFIFSFWAIFSLNVSKHDYCQYANIIDNNNKLIFIRVFYSNFSLFCVIKNVRFVFVKRVI